MFTTKKLTLYSLLVVLSTLFVFSSCQRFEDIFQEVGDEIQIPSEITIDEPALFPEGIEYDRVNQRFLISSVAQGTIGTVDQHGNYEPFIEDEAFVATAGIEIDELRQRLLVCVSDPNTSAIAALGSYDLRTGERQFWVDLAAVADDSALHFANDVAVDRHGNAYVTDSFAPIVYKVDLHGQASVFIRDNTFQPPTSGSFGLNGIVYHPNGYLLAAFLATGTLYKIPLDHPERFVNIVTEAEVATSPDGLYLSRDQQTLAVVNNGGGQAGSVVTLNSNSDWESAQTQKVFPTGAVFPTTTVQYGEDFYVLYAYLNEFFAGNTSRSVFRIVRVGLEEDENS